MDRQQQNKVKERPLHWGTPVDCHERRAKSKDTGGISLPVREISENTKRRIQEGAIVGNLAQIFPGMIE